MKIEYVSRREWGATQSTENFIVNRVSDPALSKTEIQVHHTAAVDTDDNTPNRWDYTEARAYMRRLQTSRPDLGPLPYSENLAVSEDLQTVWVFEGRGVLKRGAHTGGHNVPGVGWGVFGNFDKPDPAAAAVAVAAVEHQAHHYRTRIVQPLKRLGDAKNPNGWDAWGHRDSSSKTCPGHSLYPLLAEFDVERGGQMPFTPQEESFLKALYKNVVTDMGSNASFTKGVISKQRDGGLVSGNDIENVSCDHCIESGKTYTVVIGGEV